MDTKKVLIVVVGLALVAGGSLYVLNLTDEPDEPQGYADDTTIAEEDDFSPEDTATSPRPSMDDDAQRPSPPSPSSPRPPVRRPSPAPAPRASGNPIGPNPNASAATVRNGKPAPGSGAITSGPRGQRLEHLPSTVSDEDLARAEQTIATSDNVDQLEKAMVTLTRHRDKANIEFFIAMLRDKSEDPIVRAKAAEGLAMIGARQALPYLLEAMGDESRRVRAAANGAFIRLGDGHNYGFDPKAPRADREEMLARIRGTVPREWRSP